MDNICRSGQAGSGGGNVPSFVLATFGGDTFNFSVAGSVTINIGTGSNPNNPDGIGAAPPTSSTTGSGSISGITAPNAGYLVGVFAPSGGFSGSAAPSPYDFTTGGGTSFASLSPAVGQVFFIGDGLTGNGTGATQRFFAPSGAGSLYLGIGDAPGFNGAPGAYTDNLGQFAITAMHGNVVGTPGPIAGAGLVPCSDWLEPTCSAGSASPPDLTDFDASGRLRAAFSFVLALGWGGRRLPIWRVGCNRRLMKIRSPPVIALGCFVSTAGSAQDAMTVDFAWPRFEKCSISSMPSPAFTLRSVPAATVRLSLALTKDEDRRELGGIDLAYSPGLKLPAGTFYIRAPCTAGTYRWTVVAEGADKKGLSIASKALPLP